MMKNMVDKVAGKIKGKFDKITVILFLKRKKRSVKKKNSLNLTNFENKKAIIKFRTSLHKLGSLFGKCYNKITDFNNKLAQQSYKLFHSATYKSDIMKFMNNES